jgi:hypothetical protein
MPKRKRKLRSGAGGKLATPTDVEPLTAATFVTLLYDNLHDKVTTENANVLWHLLNAYMRRNMDDRLKQEILEAVRLVCGDVVLTEALKVVDVAYATQTAGALVVTDAMLVEVCERGDLAQLRHWGQQGVRARTWRLLRAAAANNHLDVMRCLVKELGADVKQADDQGQTTLYVACDRGSLPVLLCLVNELGADVNQGDEEGWTPLHIAAQRGHLGVVRCLLDELSADVSKQDSNGSTGIIWAAREGKLDVVRCLVREFGADINHADHDGCTALMATAARKHAALAKWLVKAGADPQAKNAENENAADISRAEGASTEQIAYLEAKAHCANPGCSGAGTKKCQGCMQGRYCGPACHVAHWPNHRAECRRLGAALKNAQAELHEGRK